MREYLFRGKTIRNGKKVDYTTGKPLPSSWVFGGIYPNSKNGSFAVIYQQEPKLEKFCVYGDTVGQFTGRYDRNKKRIFEGDIAIVTFTEKHFKSGVAYDTEFSFVEQIVYDESNACFAVKINREGIDMYRPIFSHRTDNIRIKDIEVIGNIHDNPELLEEV